MSDDDLPNSAKAAMVVQAFVTCLVLIKWGAWATWGRLPYSIEASGIVFCPALVLCIVATFGLGQGKMFGWVAELLGNAVTSLIFGFFAFPLLILPAGCLVFLLTRNVREFYVRDYYE